MSTNYTTYQQHEPFRIPSNWGVQEKKFIYQLEETFDDIYKRFGRLRLEDMGAKFRKSYEQTMEDSSMYKTEIEAGAQGITTLTIKTGVNSLGANETLYSKIIQNATGITTLVTKSGINNLGQNETLYSEITQNATGITNLITKTGINSLGTNETLYSKITQDEASWKATFRKIGASGYTAEGITEINENGVKVTHSSMNCYTQMSAAGFKILDSSNNLMGGITTLNNQVVTAMSNMYNPTYPLLNLNIGAWNAAAETGNLAQGLIYHFGPDIPAAIGIFREQGQTYYTYEMESYGNMDLYASQSMLIESSNRNATLLASRGDIHLYAPSGDVKFRFVFNGQTVNFSIREIYDHMYGGW